MADSTSVNLFKVLSAACALKQGRTKIVTERQNFPTDNYIAEGVIAQLNQGHSLHYTDTPENLFDALDDDVAVVYLTHINYRNGRMLDMAALTRAAHAHGALMIWDLAHSTGAVPFPLPGQMSILLSGAPINISMAGRVRRRFFICCGQASWPGFPTPFRLVCTQVPF